MLTASKILLLVFLSLPMMVAALPQEEAVPGGVVILPLSPASSDKPKATFEGNPVLVVAENGLWQAVIGVPLDLQPGTHQLEVDKNGQPRSLTFKISDKQYPTQHITIKDKRKVNPNQYDMERINRERSRIDAALQRWTENDDVNFNFVWPVKGRVSGLFGRRRVFNGEPRQPHSGMDIAAATGTPAVLVFSTHAKPGIWFPFGAAHRVLYPGLAWSGGDPVVMREAAGETNITLIPPAQVVAACEAVLAARSGLGGS